MTGEHGQVGIALHIGRAADMLGHAQAVADCGPPGMGIGARRLGNRGLDDTCDFFNLIQVNGQQHITQGQVIFRPHLDKEIVNQVFIQDAAHHAV